MSLNSYAHCHILIIVFASLRKQLKTKNVAGFFLAFATLGFLLFELTSCTIDQEKNISYTGSSTIGESIIRQAFEAFSKKTGVKVGSIDTAGSGKGVEAVLAGRAKLGGVSRRLFAEEKQQGLHQTRIGFDGILVFVHHNNPIRDLSKRQLKNIFIGRIRNWKEVGGRDSPIVVVTEIIGEQNATVLEFQKLIMDSQPYLSERQEVNRPAEQVLVLQKNDNAIISVSIAFSAPGIKPISINHIKPSHANIRSGKYPLTRPIYLFTKGAPKGIEKKFLDFILSKRGQEIVCEHFCPAEASTPMQQH